MPRPTGSKSTPSYCRHKSSGRAFVTIGGMPVYLGKYGTPASRQKYDRVIGEWLANGRRLAPAAVPSSPTTVAIVNRLLWRTWIGSIFGFCISTRPFTLKTRNPPSGIEHTF